MALSLSAAQKNLRSIFINDDGYIIPSFQRPYSWSRKEVGQLYEDITEAFLSDEDYFVGNIVIANSNRDLAHPNIIDGQQRLITLWLFAKVLSGLSSNNKLRKMLTIESDNGDTIPKICSNVFESDDNESIMNIVKLDLSKPQQLKKRIKNDEALMMINAKYAYRCFLEFFNNLNLERQEEFITYFLNRVSLLPIELDGATIEEATSRALVIFETINNRGLDLSDADILKAKLYEMANSVNEDNSFKRYWEDLGTKCREFRCEINDIFRFYLRILRAKHNLTTSEPNLRNYFMRDPDSPFKKKQWSDILEDLNNVADAIGFMNSLRYSSAKAALLFRILEAHPSNLPISSLVVFVYTNRLEDEFILRNKSIKFLESLIRECYILPLTSDIKYKVFEINSAIVNKRNWEVKYTEISDIFYEERRRMRNGFVMLYHYLIEDNIESQQMRTEFEVERIVSKKDKPAMIDWPKDTQEEDLESIANFSIIDFPKNYKPLNERSKNYNSSSLNSIKNILKGENIYSYCCFKERENIMKNILTKFLLNEKGNNK